MGLCSELGAKPPHPQFRIAHFSTFSQHKTTGSHGSNKARNWVRLGYKVRLAKVSARVFSVGETGEDVEDRTSNNK